MKIDKKYNIRIDSYVANTTAPAIRKVKFSNKT
jgi:hypothetical protein